MDKKQHAAHLSKLDRDKKKAKLGMSPSAARDRLTRQLLWREIKDTPCYRCGEAMSLETYSIEHVVPWLNSEAPIDVYFNLDNVSFSHSVCNKRANTSKTGKGLLTQEEIQERQRKASRLYAARQRATNPAYVERNRTYQRLRREAQKETEIV